MERPGEGLVANTGYKINYNIKIETNLIRSAVILNKYNID